MDNDSFLAEVEEERKKNLKDIIRHAKWEAEMVKRVGIEWFRIRDEWLIQTYEADKKMWENPAVREALIKAILLKDKIRAKRRSE